MAREMKLEQTTVYRAVVRLRIPDGTREITVVFGPYQDAKVAGGAQAYIERTYGRYGYVPLETRVEELTGEWHEIGRPETRP